MSGGERGGETGKGDGQMSAGDGRDGRGDHATGKGPRRARFSNGAGSMSMQGQAVRKRKKGGRSLVVQQVRTRAVPNTKLYLDASCDPYIRPCMCVCVCVRACVCLYILCNVWTCGLFRTARRAPFAGQVLGRAGNGGGWRRMRCCCPLHSSLLAAATVPASPCALQPPPAACPRPRFCVGAQLYIYPYLVGREQRIGLLVAPAGALSSTIMRRRTSPWGRNPLAKSSVPMPTRACLPLTHQPKAFLEPIVSQVRHHGRDRDNLRRVPTCPLTLGTTKPPYGADVRRLSQDSSSRCHGG